MLRATVTDHQHQVHVHAKCNLHIRKRTLNSLLEYQVIGLHEIFSRDIFTLFLLVRIHEISELHKLIAKASIKVAFISMSMLLFD